MKALYTLNSPPVVSFLEGPYETFRMTRGSSASQPRRAAPHRDLGGQGRSHRRRPAAVVSSGGSGSGSGSSSRRRR